jgi:AcrR family transcriptional regulator
VTSKPRSGRPGRGRSFPVSPTLRQPAKDLGPRATRTMAQILEATKSIFLTHGYAGTTVDEIARVAGISRGSFYTYFPSKRDVLLALGAESAHAGHVMIDYLKEINRPITDAALEDFVHKAFVVYDEQASFIFAWTQAAHQDKEIRVAGMKGHLHVCAALGRALGELRGEPFEQPAAQGLALFSQLERSWSYCQLYADRTLQSAVQRAVAHNLGDILNSASKEPVDRKAS